MDDRVPAGGDQALSTTDLAPAAGLLLLGAWTAADTTAFLQLMVSQPLVAGWLAGAVVGQPAAGLAVGVVLQAVWGRSFALGGASFPLVGPAAVAAGAVAGWAARGGATPWGGLALPGAVPLAAALVVAFAVAETGRRAVILLRRRRGGLVRRALAAAEAGSAGGVLAANLTGAVQSAALGAGLAALGLVLGRLLLAGAAGLPAGDGRWVALPVLGVGLGHAVTLVERSRRGWVWFAVLLGLGALGWWLR